MRGRLVVRALVVVALAVVCALPAVAVGGGESGGSMFAGPEAVDALGRAADARAGAEARRETSAAREEREASRTRFRDRSGEDARAVARSAFPETLGGPPRVGLRLAEGERIERYLGDYAAVVSSPGGSAIVSSVAPLRAETAEGSIRPVDLRLERQGSWFRTVNAVADLALGSELGSGFTVGGDVGVRLAGSRETAATLTGPGVFYANALEDTDFFVAPTLGGAQTFLVVRSPRGPASSTLVFDMPAGTGLRAAAKPPWAPAAARVDVVEIVRGEEVVGTIAPPVAYDAQGKSLEVSYALDGNRLTVALDGDDQDVAYPLLVDPVISYFGRDGSPGNFSGWSYSALGPVGSAGGPGAGFASTYAFTNNPPATHSYGMWWFRTHNNQSYVYKTQFSGITHVPNQSYAVTGLYNDTADDWEPGSAVYDPAPFAGITRTSCARGGCPVSGSVHNRAMFGIHFGAPPDWWGPNPSAQIDGATVWESDDNNPTTPTVTRTLTANTWHHNATDRVAISATDRGLGMGTLTITPPGHPPVSSAAACDGTYSRRCPDAHSDTLSYTTNNMPEGINTVTARATDVLTKPSPQTTWQVKVDRSGPILDVSGPLREEISLPVSGNGYELWVEALDGSESEPRSGVRSIEVRAAPTSGSAPEQRLEYVEQSCAAGSCEMDHDWAIDADALPAGEYQIRVIARDVAGNATETSWQVRLSRDSEPVDDDFANETASAQRSRTSFDCVLSSAELLSPTIDGFTYGSWLGGVEVTEWLRFGGYRVSRCGFLGDLVVQQTVKTIAVPGGTAQVPTKTYRALDATYLVGSEPVYGNPSDPGWAAEWEANKSAIVAAVLPPTAGPRAQAGTSEGPDAEPSARPECRYKRARYVGYTWASRSQDYRTNVSGFDTTAKRRDLFRKRFINGHRSWNETRNTCGYRDKDNFVWSHQGPTERPATDNRDNTNTRDAGIMQGDCRGGVACHMPRLNRSGVLVESDVRLNRRLPFWYRVKAIERSNCVPAAGSGATCYDAWATMAHEVGHALGLDEVTADRYQTMYSEENADYRPEREYRTLARSDVRGMRVLYPEP